jgi:hypothetical protein
MVSSAKVLLRMDVTCGSALSAGAFLLLFAFCMA